MPTMTAAQQAVADAANLLAKTEYDANKALLGKLTTFLSDVAAIQAGMGFPPSYQSPIQTNVTQITQNLQYIATVDLPQRIAQYEAANAPAPAAPTAASPATA